MDRNIETSHRLCDLVRDRGYLAFEHDGRDLRVGPGRVVPIGIDLYVVDGDRSLFQFIHPRIDRLSHDEAVMLASLMHQEYAVGDFAGAEIEIADLSAARKRGPREPRIYPVPVGELLSREELESRVGEVYKMLEDIAAEIGGP